MAKRIFILVRHAHRDTDMGRSRDNGLSEKGRDQAKAFRDHFLETYGSKTALLLSSPKKRCLQTLEPLSHKIATPVEVEALLDEQSEGESFSDLEDRVSLFQAWREAEEAPLVVASSHGDWIPSFADKTVQQALPLKKGAWLTFEISEKKKWKLVQG